ncbi:hypothetical protein DMUE_0958 [Dictyocoela muelleri]|nr:hypothetical protein DMUE_0958 [Dictyocoela muelleri]
MFNKKDYYNKNNFNSVNLKHYHHDSARMISGVSGNHEFKSIIEYYLRLSRIPPRHVNLNSKDERGDEQVDIKKNEIAKDFLEVNIKITGNRCNNKRKKSIY